MQQLMQREAGFFQRFESFGLPGCSGRLAIFRRCRSRLVALGPASPKSLTGSGKKSVWCGGAGRRKSRASPSACLKRYGMGRVFVGISAKLSQGSEQAAADLGDVQSLQQRACRLPLAHEQGRAATHTCTAP